MTTNKTPLKRPPVAPLIEAINAADDLGRNNMAARCGTSVENLRQIGYGYGSCSLALAKNIVAEGLPGVTITDLLPALAGVEI